jgi:hypothetical protein
LKQRRLDICRLVAGAPGSLVGNVVVDPRGAP